MIRLLGAITGSALALATLLVFVGVPQFKFDTGEPADVEQAVVTLPLPTQPVEPVVESVMDASPQPLVQQAAEPGPVEEPIQTATNPRPVAATEAPQSTDIAPEFGAPEYVPDPLEAGAVPNVAEELEPDSLNWYAFWSPFRSEIAATGFVDQLERVTGLDYRVVKVKPGVYEVAFAYSDDTEIAGNLSRITAATGLEMPEG